MSDERRRCCSSGRDARGRRARTHASGASPADPPPPLFDRGKKVSLVAHRSAARGGAWRPPAPSTPSREAPARASPRPPVPGRPRARGAAEARAADCAHQTPRDVRRTGGGGGGGRGCAFVGRSTGLSATSRVPRMTFPEAGVSRRRGDRAPDEAPPRRRELPCIDPLGTRGSVKTTHRVSWVPPDESG